MSELTKDWKKVKLGDVAEFTNGGAWNSNEYTDFGISVVQVTNISNNTIVLDQCKFLLPESLMKYKKHLLFEGDLVISTVGSHPTQPNSVVGRVAIIPKFVQGSLLNQNAVKLSPKSKKLDKKYLGHLGKSPFFRNYIIAHARGSANQVRMSIGLLKEMDIHLPPLIIQKKIASILSNYDDLIENNTRRIEILEEMAKLVYDEWFVKFRFPGHETVKMVSSEFGEIPEGWEVKYLHEVAEVKYGFPFKSKLFTQEIKENFPVIRIRDILNGFTTTYTSEDTCEDYFVTNGDILVGMDGDFHISKWSGGKAYLNQRVVRFRPKMKNFPWYYLFFALKPKIKYFDDTITGTTVAHLSARDINSIKLVSPSEDILSKIYSILEPINILELDLKIKNQNLRKTRDLLLPKLISGEIDVSDLNIRIRNENQES